MNRSIVTKRNSTNAARMRNRIKRDKPNCHICGKEIDYELHYLEPKAFVIDHVKALKNGGKDTIDNVKAAHRECNSKKRAREFAPIIRRSGTLG